SSRHDRIPEGQLRAEGRHRGAPRGRRGLRDRRVRAQGAVAARRLHLLREQEGLPLDGRRRHRPVVMELGRRIASRLHDATFDRIAQVGLANAATHRPHIRRSVLELAKLPLGAGDAALVVAAGPSLHRRRSLERLAARGFPGTVVAAATSAAPSVVSRCRAAGMELFWWNPMYDDYERPDSVSRELHRENGLPCLNGGGNVGTASWVLAHAVLGKRRVGIIGMDFGYPPDTPYEKTQY